MNSITGIEAGAHYIRHCRSLGFSDPEITMELVKAGWSQADINAAIVIAAEAVPASRSTRWLWIVLAAVVLGLVVAVAIVAYQLTVK